MKDIRNLLNTISNKTLLVVFPHPDDETMAAGGLIMAAKRLDWKVIVVCLTKGGAGKIHIHANGYSLKEIREKELSRATQILGVDEVILTDYDDGKLKNNKKEIARLLHGYIFKHNPGLLVTYDPSGFYGHPDHITLSRELYDKFQILNSNNQINSKDSNSKQGPNTQLLFVSVSPEFRKTLLLRGMREVRNQMTKPTHRLDLKWNWIKKWLAARAHKSQGLGKSMGMPLWLYMAKNHFEYYHLVNKKDKYKFIFSGYQI